MWLHEMMGKTFFSSESLGYWHSNHLPVASELRHWRKKWSNMSGAFFGITVPCEAQTVLDFVVAMWWSWERCSLPAFPKHMTDFSLVASLNVIGIPSLLVSPSYSHSNPQLGFVTWRFNVLPILYWLGQTLCMWSFLLTVRNSNKVLEDTSVQHRSMTYVSPFVLQDCGHYLDD